MKKIMTICLFLLLLLISCDNNINKEKKESFSELELSYENCSNDNRFQYSMIFIENIKNNSIKKINDSKNINEIKRIKENAINELNEYSLNVETSNKIEKLYSNKSNGKISNIKYYFGKLNNQEIFIVDHGFDYFIERTYKIYNYEFYYLPEEISVLKDDNYLYLPEANLKEEEIKIIYDKYNILFNLYFLNLKK